MLSSKKLSRVMLFLVVVGMIVVLIAGCGKGKDVAKDDDVYVITTAFVSNTEHIQGRYLLKLNELVEEASGGRLMLDIHFDGALGDQHANIQQVTLGDIHMSNIASPIGDLDRRFLAFEFPFLYRDRDHMEKVVTSDIVNEIIEDVVNKEGVRVLAVNENGFRHMTNNVGPILGPEQLRGLKIRVPNNPLRLETFNAFGAAATPMDWPELYSALQTGVVDGQENPYNDIIAGHLYEVQKYLTITSHVYNPGWLVINEEYYQSLPDDLRQILSEKAQEAAVWAREFGAQLDKEGKSFVEGKGMIVNEVDTVPFFNIIMEKIVPMYPEYAEIIERVQAM